MNQYPLDGAALIKLLETTSTSARLQNADFIVQTLLSEDPNAVDDRSITAALDYISSYIKSWLNCANPKVASKTLDVISLLGDRGDNKSRQFLIFLREITECLVGKLTDKRQEFRESVLILLHNFLLVTVDTGDAQSIVECVINSANNHSKHPQVQQWVLIFIRKNYDDATVRANITVSRFLPYIVCQYATSSNSSVKEESLKTLCLIYKHNGSRVQSDIVKRFEREADYERQRLEPLLANFNQIHPNANLSQNSNSNHQTQSTRTPSNNLLSASDSLFDSKAAISSASSLASSSASHPNSTNAGSSSHVSHSHPVSKADLKGANDTETFKEKYLEKLISPSEPKSKSLEEIQKLLCLEADRTTQSNNWEQRVSAFRQIRWYVHNQVLDDSSKYEDFWNSMKKALPLQVQDARSQIQVEACVTVCFIAQEIRSVATIFGQEIVPACFTLIRSTVRVVASSGWVTLQLFLQQVPFQPLLPLIMDNRKGKSKQDRLKTFESLKLIFNCWPEKVIKSPKHKALLLLTVKDGFADADNTVRALVRDTWYEVHNFYPKECDDIRKNLPSIQAKQLDEHKGGVRPASAGVRNKATSSLPARPKTAVGVKSTRVIPNQVRASNAIEKHSMRLTPRKQEPRSRIASRESNQGAKATTPLRSMSAIDTNSAMNSAKKYGNIKSKINMGGGSTYKPLQRLRKNSCSSIDSGSNKGTTSVQNGQSSGLQRNTSNYGYNNNGHVPVIKANQPKVLQYRGRKPDRMSMSTPGSRHESPESVTREKSSNNAFQNLGNLGTPRGSDNQDSNHSTPVGARGRTNTETPTSSREPRSASRQRRSRIPRSNNASRGPSRDPSPGSANRSKQPNSMLGQGVGAENLLARKLDGLMNDSQSPRRAESPAQSTHSYTESDITTILSIIQSEKSNSPTNIFSQLIDILQSENTVLLRSQVFQVKEIAAVLLAEANPRTMTQVLELTTAFIQQYHDFIHDWLFILLKHILKISSNLDAKQQMSNQLSTTQKRLLRTTHAIKSKFPVKSQFEAISEYLTGKSQVLDAKLKYTVLRYLTEIVSPLEKDLQVYGSSGEGLNLEDLVVSTFSKILDISNTDRSSDVRMMADRCFIRFFKANPAKHQKLFQKMDTVHQAMLSKLLRSTDQTEEASSQKSSESASISDLARDINQHYGMGDMPTRERSEYEKMDTMSDSVKSESTSATRSSFANNENHEVIQVGNCYNGVSLLNGGNINGVNNVNIRHNVQTGHDGHNGHTNGYTHSNGVHNGVSNYSTINMPSMQNNHNLLQEADMRQTYDTVLSWNSSTMQPTEQARLTALTKIRSNSSELTENLKLRQKVLTEICNMVMTSNGKTVDYAVRAMDAVCKRQMEQEAQNDALNPTGTAYTFCLQNLIQGNQPKSESGEILTYIDSQMDAAFTSAQHTPWPDCFDLLLSKLSSNVNALKLFADRIKSKCRDFEGNSIQDITWIERIAEPLCELCNSDMSTVRKNAIFSIVELYRQVGEEKLRGMLSDKLQPSKLKLVNLYISRMTK